MIRIVLAEDQGMVRDALATLLGMESDIEVVGSAGNGDKAYELVRSLKPDVLLADIEMPGRSGIELAEALEDSETHVIIVTTFDRPGYLRRALDAGVRGYLLKDSPGDELPEAIRKVAKGGRVVDPDLAVGAWGDPDPNSQRDGSCRSKLTSWRCRS